MPLFRTRLRISQVARIRGCAGAGRRHAKRPCRSPSRRGAATTSSASGHTSFCPDRSSRAPGSRRSTSIRDRRNTPGSGCLNWALYDGADQHGVTAHLMDETVDGGTIVECRRFPLLCRKIRSVRCSRARITKPTISSSTSRPGWHRVGKTSSTKRSPRSATKRGAARPAECAAIDKLQIVDVACTKTELERVIRATYTPDYPPVIELHGYRFFLRTDR